MSLNRRLANLGKVIDSASTGHFLSKGDSDGKFSTVAYSSISGRPSVVLDSAQTTNLIDSAYIQARQTAAGASGLDSAGITGIVDSSYVAARAGSGSGSGFAKYQYTATQGQTTFQDSSSTGSILSYSEDYILVHYNGVVLPASDYTATDGSSVVLGTGADSGAIVTIAKWAAASSGGGSSSMPFTGDRGISPSGEYNGSSNSTTIQYFDISTPGNASTFGTLGVGGAAGCSNGSRGLHGGGGTGSGSNTIDYITISTTGNTTDFGDLTVARRSLSAASDATYGIFAGGYSGSGSNVIDYVTVATTGNAQDFGDLSNITSGSSSSANSTKAMFTYTTYMEYITKATQGNAASFGSKHTNQGSLNCHMADETYMLSASCTSQNGSDTWSEEIYYVNWATTGNATDWGYTTTVSHSNCNGTENQTGRGVLPGGYDGPASGVGTSHNTIEYVTIAVASNATDFGDLVQRTAYNHCYSGS